ncbi:Alpha/Beta hydrolase protein [Cristinia sonorae]|uniref:Alpha/Beta hydrolase protein n=1 Tax=Cristinia sonorae TaxID=1940300 RepID=A0A8K0UWH9_9AGAR|nr:Alpha/Beta hydrolase protein [Cristinia sonorae]
MDDVEYAPGLSFALHLPPNPAPASSKPLLCWVHGGAWRSESKDDHRQTAARIAHATNCAVALPDYRLSTQHNSLHHPAHAQDVLNFLHFILVPANLPAHLASTYDPSKIYLIGHSCSAHMLASIYLAPAPPLVPVLAPSPALLRATKALLLTEGIYDLDLLLRSFPSYKPWFVANAFGDLPSYAHVNVATFTLRDLSHHLRWLIVHDQNDPLVDTVQSRSFHDHLAALYSAISREENVRLDLDRLTVKGHNEIFAEDAYIELVAQFVANKVA